MGYNFLNGTQQDIARFDYSLNYLFSSRDTTSEMFDIFSHMFRNDVNISFTNGPSYYDVGSNTIHWDPMATLNVIQSNGQVGAQSPALGLLHEFYHVYSLSKFASWDEYTATGFESRAAVALGEPVRPSYNSVNQFNPVTKVNNPTMHTKADKWVARDSENNIVIGAPYNSTKTTEFWEFAGGSGSGGGSDGVFFPGYWDGSVQNPPLPLIPGGYWNPVSPHSMPHEGSDLFLLITEANGKADDSIPVSAEETDVHDFYLETQSAARSEPQQPTTIHTSFAMIVGNNEIELIA